MSTELINAVRALYESRGDIEQVVQLLRDKGVSQMETVKLLRDELGFSLRDSDSAVLHSVAWSDVRSDTESLRKTFFDALGEKHNPPG